MLGCFGLFVAVCCLWPECCVPSLFRWVLCSSLLCLVLGRSSGSCLSCRCCLLSDRRLCAIIEHPVLKKRSKHAPFACMTPVWPPIIISSSPRSSTRCGGCTFQSIKRTSSLVKAQAFPGGRTRWHTVGNRYRSVFSGCFWHADPREAPATL